MEYVKPKVEKKTSDLPRLSVDELVRRVNESLSPKRRYNAPIVSLERVKYGR